MADETITDPQASNSDIIVPNILNESINNTVQEPIDIKVESMGSLSDEQEKSDSQEQKIEQQNVQNQEKIEEKNEIKQAEPKIQNTTIVSNPNADNRVPSSFELNIQRARELLVKARMVMQINKRKKLDKIMSIFLKKEKITCNDVEKFLRVSESTGGAYLKILIKENKIKQNGKLGKENIYEKV